MSEVAAALPVQAVQAIRRMRGGAQSQLMLGSDGNLWVVKFQNNPQHLRVLANEWIVTHLAQALGLTVPECDLVEVTDWLVKHSPDMTVHRERGVHEPCATGWQFGSRFAGGLMPGQVVDYLPEPQMEGLRNLGEFAGVLALDKWTGNCNGRQAVFERKQRERKYRAIFIDHGFCFNAGEWTFPDVPLRGVFARNLVYAYVSGWESFEPWLSRLEAFPDESLWRITEAIPPEWCDGDLSLLEPPMKALLARRGKVRELITAFRNSSRDPFPNWKESKSMVVPRNLALERTGKSKIVM